MSPTGQLTGEAFKLYEATEQIKGDSYRFTYALRPLKAGIDAFPSVPVAYFDVEMQRYVTLRSDPIPIRPIRCRPPWSDCWPTWPT